MIEPLIIATMTIKLQYVSGIKFIKMSSYSLPCMWVHGMSSPRCSQSLFLSSFRTFICEATNLWGFPWSPYTKWQQSPPSLEQHFFSTSTKHHLTYYKFTCYLFIICLPYQNIRSMRPFFLFYVVVFFIPMASSPWIVFDPQ